MISNKSFPCVFLQKIRKKHSEIDTSSQVNDWDIKIPFWCDFSIYDAKVSSPDLDFIWQPSCSSFRLTKLDHKIVINFQTFGFHS